MAAYIIVITLLWLADGYRKRIAYININITCMKPAWLDWTSSITAHQWLLIFFHPNADEEEEV